jgi:hypothetical protein
MTRIFICLFFLAATHVYGQTFTDGLRMPHKTLCAGFAFSHDQWTNYWEGKLLRDNQNLGTVTTQHITWMGAYGVTARLNIIAMLPYVKTNATQGTLQGIGGLQDLSVGVKYALVDTKLSTGQLTWYASAMLARPVTSYTPDFLPLSIGLGSTQAVGLTTLTFQHTMGWFGAATIAYAQRGPVTLDRQTYYTLGRLYETNQVAMPAVFQQRFEAGYRTSKWEGSLVYQQQNTLGGDDIRRQDMPFVSNRMNFSKVGVNGSYLVPAVKGLSVKAALATMVAGRNVGRSTSAMLAVLYTVGLQKQNP